MYEIITLNEEQETLLKQMAIVLNRSINDLEIIYSILEENNLLNTQEAINWYDKMNKISTRH